MQLTNAQKEKVDQIVELYKKGETKIVNFKAPTGSGKTFMAANIIADILKGSKKTMVLVATVSNAELPKAFKEKLDLYKPFLSFSDFDVEYSSSPSNSEAKHIEDTFNPFMLEENKVLVFGTSSFGKNRLWSELGYLDNFIEEANQKGWNIIYLRDEAHHEGSKQNTRSLDAKMKECASFTIQMTATPKDFNYLVELTPEELEEDSLHLLKENMQYGYIEDSSKTDLDVLQDSISLFKDIKKEYRKLSENIRPAMLIQVDSKSSDKKKSEEFEKNIDAIVKVIENNNLHYAIYFGDRKETNSVDQDISLLNMSKNDSLIDVIIFKVGPATGWDIPRACMLVQLRNVSSETLNIQTIGRIKRNPLSTLSVNPITNTYYVYSNYQPPTRGSASYVLRKEFKDMPVWKGIISKKKEDVEFSEQEFVDNFKKDILENKAFIDSVKENENNKIFKWNTFDYLQDKEKKEITEEFDNLIELRIEILNLEKEKSDIFTDSFDETIKSFSSKNNLSKDIVLYTIRKNWWSDLLKIFNNSRHKILREANYQLQDAHLMKHYDIWLDNEQKNIVGVQDIENYGYIKIHSMEEFDIVEENISSTDSADKRVRELIATNEQILDSQPEKKFMEAVVNELESDDYEDLEFFAKLPTLGSDVYFEYWNTEDAAFTRSYADFMFKTKKGQYMVEVKSFENDYDPTKTKDLLEAYGQYMKANEKENIFLCVVSMDVKQNKGFAVYWDKDEGKFIEPELVQKFLRKMLSGKL